jgi:hypothetical protein
MKIIALPRGKGKTTELIEMAHEGRGYIACYSQREVQRVAQLAISLGKPIRCPITYTELLERKIYVSGAKELYIDNVEMLLEHIAGTVPVAAATLTVNTEKETPMALPDNVKARIKPGMEKPAEMLAAAKEEAYRHYVAGCANAEEIRAQADADIAALDIEGRYRDFEQAQEAFIVVLKPSWEV